jgi:hypothetical protein
MKAWAIFKISNKDPEQYLTQEKEFTSLGKKSMMFRLIYNMNTSLELVYQDENVKIYRLNKKIK